MRVEATTLDTEDAIMYCDALNGVCSNTAMDGGTTSEGKGEEDADKEEGDGAAEEEEGESHAYSSREGRMDRLA